MLRATAAHDHDFFCTTNQISSVAHRVVIHSWFVDVRVRRHDFDVPRLCHRIPAHLDRNRSRSSTLHLAECRVYLCISIRRIFNVVSRLDDRCERTALVREFMQMAAPLAQELRHDLPCQAQDWQIAPGCSTQCSRGVKNTGPRHDCECTWFAGCRCVSHRHVGSALLVTAKNSAYIRRTVNRVEHWINLCARQTEYRVYAIGNCGTNHCFAAAHGFSVTHRSGDSQVNIDNSKQC